MSRYDLRFEMDSLYAYLLDQYGIELDHEDMEKIRKFVYMKPMENGQYTDYVNAKLLDKGI